MVARAIVSFLMLAAVWILGIPDQVSIDDRAGLQREPGSTEPAGPEPYADGMGLPGDFDAPIADRSLAIDPTPHRAAIHRIEAVLYRRAQTDFGDAEAVGNGATRLAEAVLAAGSSPGSATGRSHRQAGLTLFTFAKRVDSRSQAGYTLPSLVALRGEWEAVRATVFRPADWMRTSSRELDLLQEPPPPAMDPRTDEVIQSVESELRRLMSRGRRTAERLGEPSYDPDLPGQGDPGQIQAWQRFGQRWRRQLTRATEPLRSLSPPPHPQREPLRAEAVRSLRDAHESLRRIPEGAGMWPTPFQTAWEARLQVASAALARTREQRVHAESLATSVGDSASATTASPDRSRWSR